MSPSVKYYLRSLFPIGITFIIVSMLLDLAYGRAIEPLNLLVDSFIFALIFAGLMNFIHYGYVKSKLKRAPNYEELKPLQEAKIQLSMKLDELYQKLKKDPLKGAFFPKYKDGVIRFKLPASGSSWGEFIEIEKVDESPGEFLIRSRPKTNLNLFDNGKAIENINLIRSHLKELESSTPE